jgi:hypothetical protein
MTDLFALTLIGQTGGSLITWTPVTFYIAVALAQAIVIYAGYRFLGTDPLYATLFNALMAAGIGNVIFFVLRGYEALGVVLGSLAFVGLLFAFSGGDMLRSVVVFLLAMATYFGAGQLAVQHTPLSISEISGPPELLMNGGFKAQPLKPGEAEKILESGESAVDGR